MIGDWIFDHLGWVLVFLVILMAAGEVWLGIESTKQTERERIACIEGGYTWKIIGSHIRVTYIKSGDVLVPIEDKVTDWGCTK